MPFKFGMRDSEGAEKSADTNDKKKSRPRSLLGLLRSSKWRRKNKETKSVVQRDEPAAITPVKSSTSKTNKIQATTSHLEPPTSTQTQAEANTPAGKDQDEPAIAVQPHIAEELREEDIHNLFSGAPHFSVGLEDGQYHPTAAFPWDFDLDIRDVSDCPPLEHPAFSSSTLRRHLPRPGEGKEHELAIIEYKIGVVEVPCMLSARGNEPGTIGFEHFLQEPIADSLQVTQSKAEGEDEFTGLENHELLQSDPEQLGIRKFDLEYISERLVELSDMYRDFKEPSTSAVNILNRETPAELYALLFARLLTSPKFDARTEDPTGMKVQIEALLSTLKIKAVWFDFSNVEWRIRMGQTFWTEVVESDLSDGASETYDSLSDRHVLLLQLLLSCELLLRLDAVASLSTREVKEELHLTAEEVNSFRTVENRKTQWDLVLARRFLDNIEAKCVTTSKVVSKPKPARRGFFSVGPQIESTTRLDQVDVMFLPRKPEQQLSGLFHFGSTLSWPDADRFKTDLTEALRAKEDAFSIPSPAIYATPLSSPRSTTSDRSSSYFDAMPQFSRSVTQRSLQLQPASPTPGTPITSPNDSSSSKSLLPAPKALIGGWLTRSYLTGLIMPGEPISHFLISTILENDASAIAVLGDSANLYSGFIYRGRTFWSKSCIVARVLACVKGTSECMGWVSVPCVPSGFEDGWIDVKSLPVEVQKPPRIEDNEALELDSSFLAGNELNNIKPADFVLPRDPTDRPVSSIQFGELRLEIREDNHLIGDSTPSFTASLSFSCSSLGNEMGHPIIPLSHLVHFVSAYPCTTPAAEKLLLLKNAQENTTAAVLPAHPLHTSQPYQLTPATALLQKSFSNKPEDQEVLILDARGNVAMELLSRAWCSSNGEHAIISRVGVTCLACTVREARALAIRVAVRVE